MKNTVLLLLLVLAIRENVYSQDKYISKNAPVTIDKPAQYGGDYQIKVSINTLPDSSAGVPKSTFNYKSLDAIVVTDQTVTVRKVDPTTPDDRLFATYVLSSANLGLNGSLSSLNWKCILYTVNYELNDQLNKTFQEIFVNPALLNPQNPAFVEEITIIQPGNVATYKIKPSIGDFTLTDVIVKRNNDVVAQKKNDMRKNPEGTWEGSLQDNITNYNISLAAGSEYTVEIKYRSGGTSGSCIQKCTSKEVQNFYVYKVSGLDYFDNTEAQILVETTNPAKELKANFNGKDMDWPFTQVEGNKYKFVMPLKEFEQLNYGTYDLRFTGQDLLGNKLSNSSVINKFKKNKPIVSSIEVTKDNENNTTCFKAYFGEPLSRDTKIVMAMQTENKTYVPLPMVMCDAKTFSLNFSWKDEIIKSHFTEQDKKVAVTVRLERDSKLELSPGIVLPVQILSKEKLQEIVDSEGSKKTKREKVAKYLEDQKFDGKISDVAEEIVKELGKNQPERNWDNVWSQVVKLAPKIIGSLVMLI